MIGSVITWSARNGFLVLLATAFIVFAGVYAVWHTALDAIPDLSDTQVIVYTEDPGQAPQVIEDQVTYPLTTALACRAALQGGARLLLLRRVLRLCRVRGRHGPLLGALARARISQFCRQAVAGRGSRPRSGPTRPASAGCTSMSCSAPRAHFAELRTIQDWYLRYQLTKAEGVAEIASVGGFVQQYQVVVDPQKLQGYGLTLGQLTSAIRASNRDVGGRVVEMAETEYVVRGRGYLRNTKDLEEIALKMQGGTPVLLRDVARVELGPEERRGIAELNGQGEVVSGIALQRDGQNALHVIDSVKQKLAEIAPSLPQGVTVEAVYDRSDLIHRAIETLKHTLTEESIIVALVCIVFLLHVRSALVAILMLPVGVLIALGLLHALGLSSNIMSLGGIAIALGAMVDAAIVMIENAHKHLERAAPGASRARIITDAALEVGPALFFSLAVITVSFLPVFTLEDQEGRLFKPLALTKTFAMGGAALLSITLVPVLMQLFVRGRILPEARNPLNRRADLALPAGHRRRAARAPGDDPDRPARARRHGNPAPAAGLGIHADAERRHADVYAGQRARHVRHQGGRAAADHGPHHQKFSRGGERVRQGRPRRHRDRSGAARDVRDHHQPQARGPVAPRRHHRTPSRPR